MFGNLGPLLDSRMVLNDSLNADNFNVCHLNAQSMVPRNSSTKFDEMKYIFDDCKYDIIGVSETWLKSYVSDGCVAINGFQIFRNDRCWMRGGGVCIYVSDRYKVRVVNDYMDEGNIESLFVEVNINESKLLVGIIYLPHGKFSECEDLLIDLSTRYNNAIFMGDFNTDLFSNSSIVRNFCDRSNLSVVHNSLPTHINEVHFSSSLIDYFFVSNIDLVNQKKQYQFPALNSGHAIISISYQLRKVGQLKEFFYRDYRKMDSERCMSIISELVILNFFSINNVEEQSKLFNDIVSKAFVDSVPLKRCEPRKSDKWLESVELKKAKVNRDLAWSAYYECSTLNNRKIYCKYRNKVKSVIRRLRRSNDVSFFSSCSQSQMWSRLKSSGVYDNDNASNSFLDIEEFNQQCLLPPIDHNRSRNHFFQGRNGFTFRNVDSLEIFEAMVSIKKNSVGPDGIPLKFLKIIFPIISPYFTFHLNSIITFSIFLKC